MHRKHLLVKNSNIPEIPEVSCTVQYSILFFRVNTYFESILSYAMSNLELPIIHLDSSTEEERRTEAIHLLEAFQRSSFFSTQVGKNGCLIDWSLFFDDL